MLNSVCVCVCVCVSVHVTPPPTHPQLNNTAESSDQQSWLEDISF